MLHQTGNKLKALGWVLVAFGALLPLRGMATINVGCPWFQTYDSTIPDLNRGVPDANAAYWMSRLSNNPAAGSEIVMEGTFPHARYFSFVVYGSIGKLLGHLADSEIYPDETGVVNDNVAMLPTGYGLDYHYKVVVKFSSAPNNPEPNTIYVPIDSGIKQQYKIFLRIYLPDAGTDETGGVGLPVLHYSGPLGEIDLSDTPDAKACGIYYQFAGVNPGFHISWGAPPTKPLFTINTNNSFLTQNADAGVLTSKVGSNLDDLVLVRGKAPATPLIDPLAPEIRYWSLCQNSYQTTAVVACVPDRDAPVQSDGYYNIVVSPTEKRPTYADEADGYAWIPWGDDSTGFLMMRQLLALPDFAGNFNVTAAGKFYPNAKILGEWAPTITYCDSATFDANASLGGAAVFSACQAAHAQAAATMSKRRK